MCRIFLTLEAAIQTQKSTANVAYGFIDNRSRYYIGSLGMTTTIINNPISFHTPTVWERGDAIAPTIIIRQ
jgi:hypothetical protein